MEADVEPVQADEITAYETEAEKVLALMEKFQEVSKTLLEEMLTLSIDHDLNSDFTRLVKKFKTI